MACSTDSSKGVTEEMKSAFGVLNCLPAWKQKFADWATDVFCVTDAASGTLELCADARDHELLWIAQETDNELTKAMCFRFTEGCKRLPLGADLLTCPSSPSIVYGVCWAYKKTNLLDGKFFIWEHTNGCCNYSCEMFNCPKGTQK